MKTILIPAGARAFFSLESIMQRTHQLFALSVLTVAAWATGGFAQAQMQASDGTGSQAGSHGTDANWDQFGVWSATNSGGAKDIPVKGYTASLGDKDAPTYGNITGVVVGQKPGVTIDGKKYTSGRTTVGNAYLGGIVLNVKDGKNQVFTWGWNGQGQLGIGKTDLPLPAKGTPKSSITTPQWAAQTYGGGYVSVDFFSNPSAFYETLHIADANRDVTDSAPMTMIDVDAGYHHMIALDNTGRVWAWGYNQAGQIGKNAGAKWNYPRWVKGLPSNIAVVFASHGPLNRGQSFALTSEGVLYVWGSAAGGKLGNAAVDSTGAPKTPLTFSDSSKGIAKAKIVDVQGGDYHNLALDSDGNVWGWGAGSYLGDNSAGTVSTPKIVKLPATAGKAVKIGVSYDNSLVLDDKGQVWQAGIVFVGPGAGTARTVRTFQLVSYSTADAARVGYTPYATDIGAGESVAYFVDQHGRAWAWGDGRYQGFGREGDYIRSYTQMRTAVARQYPQVIGDGDTQRYPSDPTLSHVSATTGYKTNTDTPADNKKFGTWGFNSQHPTIYDDKYANATDPITKFWKDMAFHPLPKIQQILGSRSGYIMVDVDGNLFKWAYDGSGTIAWGDGNDFNAAYDNMGNGRDGNYDAYCYEVMLMRGGGQPVCEDLPIPNILTGGSTSSVGGSSTRVNTNSMVYVANRTASSSSMGGWQGKLDGYPGDKLDQDPTWTAQIPTPATARQIFTTDASQTKGIPFEWGNPGLTDADVPGKPAPKVQTNPINGEAVPAGYACQALDAAGNPQQAACLPGCLNPDSDDPSHPVYDAAFCPTPPPPPNQNDVDAMRNQPLGQIVNSQLVYVSRPALLSLDDDYLAFAKTVNAFNGTYRQGVVYVMANDSMLHGFDAGQGIPGSTTKQGTGQELFAYVPRGMLGQLRSISNNTATPHWVDGGMFSGDAQLGNAHANSSAYGLGTDSGNNPGHWATVLAGTLGTGAPGYFVLDVTQPSALTESDTSALAQATLIDKTDLSGLGADEAAMLGYQSSLPVMDQYNLTRQPAQITRINTQNAKGEWALIMGNGYASAKGVPALLIQSLSAAGRPLYMVTASCTAKDATGVADPGACIAAGNGLSAPRPVDVDGNGTADFVYAGDLMGNLWKFDISNVDRTQWKVAYGEKPMFTALGPTGAAQPITSAPAAVPFPNGGFMVGFGTGKNLSQADLSDQHLNSFYALYDTQQIKVELKEIGSTTPPTKTSMISLVEPAPDTFCAATRGGGATRYSGCLYQRNAGDLADPAQTAALTAMGPNTKVEVHSGAMLGWYYDIPELINGHAAKVLDNPAMMSDNVVQFFSVNVPVPAGDPGTTCQPNPVQVSDESLVFNYFNLFSGMPADNITVTLDTSTVTYSHATGNQNNRIRFTTLGRYVRSGTNSFVRAAGGDLIRYDGLDPAGKRAGWRISR